MSAEPIYFTDGCVLAWICIRPCYRLISRPLTNLYPSTLWTINLFTLWMDASLHGFVSIHVMDLYPIHLWRMCPCMDLYLSMLWTYIPSTYELIYIHVMDYNFLFIFSDEPVLLWTLSRIRPLVDLIIPLWDKLYLWKDL